MTADHDSSHQLPRLLVLTHRLACEGQGRTLPHTVRQAVEGGATTIVLREKDLPRAERARLANDLRATVPCLIVASDIDLALAVGADGVHLAARDPWSDVPVAGDLDPDASSSKRSLSGYPRFIFGQSCHDDVELDRAVDGGASYVTLSPVFPTASKPGYGPNLGLDKLARLVAGHPGLPVYALGGVVPGQATSCIQAGALGVAVMGAVMVAEDPAAMVRDLMTELSQVVAS